jgi:hypothetical protein
MDALDNPTLNALPHHADADNVSAAHDCNHAGAAAPWLYRSEGFAEDLDDSYATH